jgi:magnesium-transporting ATPase (P-type)
MVLVLLAGLVVSFAIKSWIEAGVVAFVLIVNVVVGFIQEYSAEKTMASLRSLASPTVRTPVFEFHNQLIDLSLSWVGSHHSRVLHIHYPFYSACPG